MTTPGASPMRKFLHDKLQIRGLDLHDLLKKTGREKARKQLRKQITATGPVVVALIICRSEELERARRYRDNAEASIDRVFFSDEIDACIAFLAQHGPAGAGL